MHTGAHQVTIKTSSHNSHFGTRIQGIGTAQYSAKTHMLGAFECQHLTREHPSVGSLRA